MTAAVRHKSDTEDVARLHCPSEHTTSRPPPIHSKPNTGLTSPLSNISMHVGHLRMRFSRLHQHTASTRRVRQRKGADRLRVLCALSVHS